MREENCKYRAGQAIQGAGTHFQILCGGNFFPTSASAAFLGEVLLEVGKLFGLAGTRW